MNSVGTRSSVKWFVECLALACLLMLGQQINAAEETVVLLVPGIVLNPHRTSPALKPSHTSLIEPMWSGLIDYLETHGYMYGGVISPQGPTLQLPHCILSRNTDNADPQRANLFLLDFSEAADMDGLAFRALELSQCIRELRRWTGKQIDLIAHSAGGLVVRTVLQNACPGIEKPDGVRRVVTIATPHLGAAVAANFGELVGLQVTSLKPTAGLVRRLNDGSLGGEVQYTSIVVRSLASDVGNPGNAYDQYVDLEAVRRLPVDLQRGGDDLIHVRSQNLALTPAAQRHMPPEGPAVQTVLVRVAPPGLFDRTNLETTHIAALRASEVQQWIVWILADDGTMWAGKEGLGLQRLMDWQQQQTAFEAIESATLARDLLRLREVTAVRVEQLVVLDESLDASSRRTRRRVAFSGTATYRGLTNGTANVEGVLHLQFDHFGRIVECEYSIK